MSVLTNKQVKRIAIFLKASCEKVPQIPSPPKFGQWLDNVSKELGYKDWNVTSATNLDAPELTDEQKHWYRSLWTFLGVARVLVAGEQPTHHLCYSVNRDFTRHHIATELAKKIRSRIDQKHLNHRLRYSRPDVMPTGELELNWKSRNEGCPIVIKSRGQEITIQLWWLSESYQLQENLPEWSKDSRPHFVIFDDHGDRQLIEYGDSELDDSLTDVFLEQLTGREQGRRTCRFVPKWPDSSMEPVTLLAEEGNPHAQLIEGQHGSTWTELRLAADSYNEAHGLSKVDCKIIAARYESAELIRTEDEYVEFSGVYDE